MDLLWGRIGQFDLRRLILSYRSQRPIHHESHTPHPTQLNLCTAGFQVIKYVLRFQVPAEPTTGLVTHLNSSGWLTVQSLNGAQRPFPAKVIQRLTNCMNELHLRCVLTPLDSFFPRHTALWLVPDPVTLHKNQHKGSKLNLPAIDAASRHELLSTQTSQLDAQLL